MQIHTPDWVKHAVFYQIFPDRFARSQQHRKRIIPSPQWEDWSAVPTLQGYKGGDLWGVMENLDYLKNLGITALYFTPIFQSASNHRYHTHDYYQVDPLLGGNPAFLALLEAAHHRDIKIVLDGVFNHASRGIFQFHDILENGPHSPWVDWFQILDWPLSPYVGDRPANYMGWAGNRALPVFNHDNPDVREYLMQIAEYWVRQGIDGWRLDVPFEIRTEGFWEEFRARVKAINPDAYIVGEIWGDARQWLDGTQFDGVMNYLFTGPTIAFAAGDRVLPEMVKDRDYEPYPALSATDYAEKMRSLLQRYPWEIQLTQLNLLASHDTARLLSIAGGDRASVELATLLLFTFPGAPSLYYGDEVGLEGGIDPDCRRGFPAEEEWDQSLQDYHRQLIALRHAHPELRVGDYQVLAAEGLGYVFCRGFDTGTQVVGVNADGVPVRLQLAENKRIKEPASLLFGQGRLERGQRQGEHGWILEIPPRSGCILKVA